MKRFHRVLAIGATFLLTSCASNSSNTQVTQLGADQCHEILRENRSPSSLIQSCVQLLRNIWQRQYPAPQGEGLNLSMHQGQSQTGVNPWELSPTRSMKTLEEARIARIQSHDTPPNAIEIDNTGQILNGHHRVEWARRNGHSVDVVVKQEVPYGINPSLFTESSDIYINDSLVMNRAQMTSLLELQHQQRIPPIEAAANRSENIDFAILESLSPTEQQLIRRFISFFGDEANARSLMEQLPDSLHRSIFKNIEERSFKSLNRENWVREYLNGWDSFKRLPASQKALWRLQKDELLQMHRASDEWRRYYTLTIPVEVSNRFTGQSSLVINSTRYHGRLRSDGVLVLEVPSELVRHAAWNPLSTEKLIGIAQTPFMPAPRTYPTHLRLDGRFVLDDKNHRFAVFKKPHVRVEVHTYTMSDGSRYVSAGNIENYLVDIGVSTPRSEVLVKIMNGELHPLEVVPENHRQAILWAIDDLALPARY